ncbi:MAG: UDP-N-acetylglucosamine--N-acetylmuramyl-(pentapeptide) pyrophosphoryl-undecaprenol N-acetylglucosamine transferase [Candidatus Nomurabacteria bacterium]|jgi:UDP-N-acetylglucosamine--N-acetylmuramyl-(pentapeptide) pyrophosphoryl-undecaprenol N-acetylglucosamine transferase|nr:UDP-N-acetylglucosamine--N-acetylmuramyl-(pentapeptide) pyrophosphoryl-undecaprenol N-acetylglucosamine transferase [Candidatus Nomurabacteria bacterium]
MRILCVGGGSGGHVTPVVAVIEQLQKVKPRARIEFWCDRKYSAQSRRLMAPLKIPVKIVAAGKWRRYTNLPRLYRWFSLYHIWHTHLANLRDLVFLLAGFLQSFFKLIFKRPDVIFLKGGYVCLPVGLAARLLKIPTVLHDSDTTPGLTNRILAKSARLILTGAPTKFYPNYPAAKLRFVGIPVRPEFAKAGREGRTPARRALNLADEKSLVVSVGGGLGARYLNEAVLQAARFLPEFNFVILTGQDDFAHLSGEAKSLSNVRAIAFAAENYVDLIAEADVVISRAGATSLAELALLSKPTILVPAPFLSGDHQTKNAKIYADNDAAILLSQKVLDDDARPLVDALKKLLRDQNLRRNLANHLHKFARPNAAAEIADLIVKAAENV